MSGMSVLKFWILSMIIQVLSGSPTVIEKRADIIPPKSSNSTDSRAGLQDTIAQSVNTSTTVNGKKDICPSHLVPHNLSDVTVCCVPYFNCPVGYGIKVCENDGEKDQCIPCPPFMVQKNNVSSLNMEEAECYSEENTENCPLDDTKPSWKMKSLKCLINCECKNEECFYGKDPCVCELRSPCPINYTMNRDTGACERCPQYANKDYVGCGTCTVIPELWAQRNFLPTTPEPSHQSSSVNEGNMINDDTDGLKKETQIKTVVTTNRDFDHDKPDTYTVPFPTWAIVLFFIVIIGIGIIVIILLIKRKNSGSLTHLPLIDRRLMAERDRDTSAITELQDDLEIGINLQRTSPVNGGLKDDKFAKKDERSDEVLGAVGGADPVNPREEKTVEEANVKDLNEDKLFGRENKTEASHKQTHVAPKLTMGQCTPSELEPLLNELHVVIPNNDSLCSSGLSAVESLETNLKPISIEGECEQHVPGRYDVIPKSTLELLPNVVRNNSSECAEDSRGNFSNSDLGSNDSVCDKMDRQVTERKINNASSMNASNLTQPDNSKSQYQRESKLSEVLDRAGCKTNQDLKSDHEVENTVDTINLDIDHNDSSLTDVMKEMNTSGSLLAIADAHKTDRDKELHQTNENLDEPDTATLGQNKQNFTIDIYKLETGAGSENATECEQATGIDMSHRSSDSDKDDFKIGNDAKRKIKPFTTDHEKKPMAVIVPIRQTSVQEPTMGIVHDSNNISNRQEPNMMFFRNPDQSESNVEPYMYSVLSESYAAMYMNGQTDVADLDNLVSLNASTIGADDSVSRHDQINAEQYGGVPYQNQRNVTEPDESILTNNLETHNIIQPSVTDTTADSFVQRPDLQLTCKTVEETVEEENSVTQLHEEIFAEAPVSFPSHDTENMKMTCNGDITDGCGEYLDEIDKEKLKIARTATGVEQDNEIVIEISKTNRVNNDKENEVAESNNIAATVDSQNIEATEQTYTGSIELPIDALENNSLHTSNTEQLNSDERNSLIAQNSGLDIDSCVEIICNNLDESENNEES